MRNTQRVDSLLVITSDIARINQIVAQSHDWELKEQELDDFLEVCRGDKLKKTNLNLSLFQLKKILVFYGRD